MKGNYTLRPAMEPFRTYTIEAWFDAQVRDLFKEPEYEGIGYPSEDGIYCDPRVLITRTSTRADMPEDAKFILWFRKLQEKK